MELLLGKVGMLGATTPQLEAVETIYVQGINRERLPGVDRTRNKSANAALVA